MFQYLPSKKFIIILLSIIIAGGLIYIPFFIRNQSNTAPTLPLANNYQENQTGLNLNPDTTEINQNPDRSLALQLALLSTSTDELTEFNSLTTTEKISREIFLQYLYTKEEGVPLSPEEAEAIIDKALQYLPELTFKTYTQGNLLTTKASDNETILKYSNAVAEIILNNIKNQTESIDKILAATDNIDDDSKITEETKIIFQRFTPLILKNQKTISSLLSVIVPLSLVNEHLQLLNSFEEVYEKLDLMQKSAEDLVILVQVRSGYYISVNNLATALLELTNKLGILKVTFTSENDYGYQLFNVIMSTP